MLRRPDEIERLPPLTPELAHSRSVTVQAWTIVNEAMRTAPTVLFSTAPWRSIIGNHEVGSEWRVPVIWQSMYCTVDQQLAVTQERNRVSRRDCLVRSRPTARQCAI